MAVGIYKKDDDLNADQQGAVPRPREYPWQALIYKRIAGQAEKDRHETCQYIVKPGKLGHLQFVLISQYSILIIQS